jgi:predicted TPR repeat methyltransferase
MAISRSSGDILADRRHAYAMGAKADGDLAASADLLQQALEITPSWADGWFDLGEIELARGEAALASECFRRVLELSPEDARGAALHLARLEARNDVVASPAYVATLFDDYAPRFDKALREGLSYRGPELLVAVLDRVAPGRHFARTLDLGCGTGLMAEALEGRTDILIGVDLSPRMIELARAKALYTALEVADLTEFLRNQPPSQADLVLAADVMVYVRDLAPVVQAISRALKPGGLVAFTLQEHAGEGVKLGADLRFAHARSEVLKAFEANEISLRLIESASTRQERGAPVPGLIVLGECDETLRSLSST